MAGIYFHIPFCKQACHYCNFYFTTSDRHLHSSTNAMKTELRLRKAYLDDNIVETIYFGGGTPSMLPPSEIQSLIHEVKALFPISKNLEITLEANPDNLSNTYLEALKNTDVNRFSIGIQSFFEEDLTWMNRAHNAHEAVDCLKRVLDFGYDHFSVDLILGIPGSNDEKWQYNINEVLGFRPKHISCYALTVEPKTALDYMIKKGTSPGPSDELTEKQFYMTHDLLTAAGYEHYEISNYALDGFASKHNSAYWQGKHYLGIGPSAHSFDGKSRSWNISHLPKYLKALEQNSIATETEILSKSDQYNEFVMTGIRRNTGISKSIIELEFPEFASHFEQAIQSVPAEFIEVKGDTIVLSKRGLLFADFVGSELFYVPE